MTNSKLGYSGKFEEIAEIVKRNPKYTGVAGEDVVDLIIHPKAPEGFERAFTPEPLTIPLSKKDIEEIMKRKAAEEAAKEEEENEEDGKGDDETKTSYEKHGVKATTKGGKKRKSTLSDIGEPPIWFTTRLKSIIKDNAITRVAGNKREGDLDCKHLYKAYTTGRCFVDKDVVSKKQYSFGLVVDISGSMDGEKANLAAKSTYHFVQSFQKLVPLSVILFNRYITVKKTARQIMSKKEAISLAHSVVEGCTDEGSGYNCDGGAVLKAHEELKKFRGRRVVVVLSDGEPACGCEECNKKSGAHRALIQAVKKVEYQGTTCLGIGILSPAVENYYPKYEVVKNLSELYPAILDLLQRHIKRGGI